MANLATKFSVQIIDDHVVFHFGRIVPGEQVPEGTTPIENYMSVFSIQDLAEKRCFYHDDSCHYTETPCPDKGYEGNEE